MRKVTRMEPATATTQVSATFPFVHDAIGNFRLVRRLGRGGMAEVWLGEHRSVGTKVAVKLLLGDLAADDPEIQRFFNEARAVGKIQHAGIAKIFDVGTHGERPYLIMELLDGESLGSRLRRVGALPVASYYEFGRQLASVLGATHGAGITHRDLKPENIFIVPDRELACGERIKVLDFGIAKLTGTLAGGSPRTFGAMGTPAYMAPEQWGDPSAIDERVDIYALGCVLFELACGRPPFQPTTVAEACQLHLHATPPRAHTVVPALDPEFDALVASMLSKDPGARPQSMVEVEQTLTSLARRRAPVSIAPTLLASPVPIATAPRRRRRLAVAAAIALALAPGATVAWLTTRDGAARAAVEHAAPHTPIEVGTAKPNEVSGVTPPAAPPAAAKEGKIDEDALVRVLTAQARRFHDCYQPHAVLDSTLTGRVVATFTIGLDGRAAAVTATGMSDAISGCVMSVIRSIDYPRPIGGSVPVTYPLSFQPTFEDTDSHALTIVPRGPDPDYARLRTIEPRLAACAAASDVHGKVAVTISVIRGHDVLVSVDHDYANTPLSACLGNAIGSLDFGPDRGYDTSITVPLRFP